MDETDGGAPAPSEKPTAYGKRFLLGLGLFVGPGLAYAFLGPSIMTGFVEHAGSLISLFGLWVMCVTLWAAFRERA